MAQTTNLDRLKVAALLLFVAVAVMLAGWTIWQSFAESNLANTMGDGYQASTGGTPEPTPTIFDPSDEFQPMPTDPFPMEN